MDMSIKEIKMSALIKTFRKDSSEKKYCFILGAGASRSSKIRMASELVKAWEKDLVESETEESLALWKRELGITSDNYTEFYGDYYKRRFTDYRDGYHYLEKEMEGKRPGPGYIILAYVLCNTDHNVVITTNFDHLIEDAVNQWERRFPLVIGHEALAHFIEDDIKRPVIIKIHHDLLLGPKSRNDETDKLAEKWQEYLPKIFTHYNPVFLGYGGNDHSVMNYLLENAEKFRTGEWRCPYWTVFGKKPLAGEPRKFIEAAEGICIRDCAFDSFMTALAGQIEYKLPAKKEFVESRSKEAETEYNRLNDALNKSNQDSLLMPKDNGSGITETERIVSDAVIDITKDADNSDDKNPVSIYRNAVRAIADGMYDHAIDLFNNLIRRKPYEALYHYSFGVALHKMKRYEEALQEKQKAIKLEPDNAMYHDSLSTTLHEMKRYEEALQETQKAIELEPDNAIFHDSLSATLHAMKRYKEALAEAKKAVNLEPDNAKYFDSLGITLCEMKRYEDALQETQKAADLEPDNARYHYNLGKILHILKRYKEAVKEKQKAIELEPKNEEYRSSLDLTLQEMKQYKQGTLAKNTNGK